jgi:hypothetical protein
MPHPKGGVVGVRWGATGVPDLFRQTVRAGEHDESGRGRADKSIGRVSPWWRVRQSGEGGEEERSLLPFRVDARRARRDRTAGWTGASPA